MRDFPYPPLVVMFLMQAVAWDKKKNVLNIATNFYQNLYDKSKQMRTEGERRLGETEVIPFPTNEM
jgi:hypothetical protein